MADKEVIELDDEVKLWIDQETIMLKACSGRADPTELTPDAARALARVLLELADKADAE